MGTKEEFLDLLKKDEEFRYTVLGYLGLDELTRRMDATQTTQTKILEEQTRIWEEIRALREDFNEILVRVEALEAGHERLERSLEGFRSEMYLGFNSLRKFAGVSLEEFMRVLLSGSFRERGILPAEASLERAVVEGEEINLFYPDPLIVGEVTAYTDSVEEISKLLRRAEAAKRKYGKEPEHLLLIVMTAPRHVARQMRRIDGSATRCKANETNSKGKEHRPCDRKGSPVRITGELTPLFLALRWFIVDLVSLSFPSSNLWSSAGSFGSCGIRNKCVWFL
ncbi:MAG: hypothetical protein ACTSP1_19275 [Candidatus Freyarchaeota archaeon]